MCIKHFFERIGDFFEYKVVGFFYKIKIECLKIFEKRHQGYENLFFYDE